MIKIINSTKKLIAVPLVVGALTQPSYSWGNWKIEKTGAAIMGGIVCYTHPEYQIKENTCIIDRLVGVGKYGKVDIKEPYEVRLGDKVKVRNGGDGFIFCYKKPGEKDDDFCVAAVIEPPHLYFSKLKKQKEEKKARCNRRHIRRPRYIAGINGSYIAGINGSYIAGVTPLDEDEDNCE